MTNLSTCSVWPPAYSQVNQYQPEAGGVSIYQPLQYSSSSSVVPPPPAEPPGFLSHYTQPTPLAYPGQPPVSQCLSSSPPSYTPFFPTSSPSSSLSYSAPPSSAASFQHGGPGSPVSYMPPPPSQCGISGTQHDTEPMLKPAPWRTGLHGTLINFPLLVLTNKNLIRFHFLFFWASVNCSNNSDRVSGSLQDDSNNQGNEWTNETKKEKLTIVIIRQYYEYVNESNGNYIWIPVWTILWCFTKYIGMAWLLLGLIS